VLPLKIFVTSYLCELSADEPGDKGRLSRPTVADEGDIAVVAAALGLTLTANTAHREKEYCFTMNKKQERSCATVTMRGARRISDD
jgi:hypothetical protein